MVVEWNKRKWPIWNRSLCAFARFSFRVTPERRVTFYREQFFANENPTQWISLIVYLLFENIELRRVVVHFIVLFINVKDNVAEKLNNSMISDLINRIYRS